MSNSINETNTNSYRSGIATAIRVLVVMEAVVFAIAALLHSGVALPVGLAEPVIIPAATVEGLIALFFAGSAYLLFARQRWAWQAAIFAHAFAAAGILLGIAALALGRGPTTDANYIYHRVMLAVAATALALLLTPLGRGAPARK